MCKVQRLVRLFLSVLVFTILSQHKSSDDSPVADQPKKKRLRLTKKEAMKVMVQKARNAKETMNIEVCVTSTYLYMLP